MKRQYLLKILAIQFVVFVHLFGNSICFGQEVAGQSLANSVTSAGQETEMQEQASDEQGFQAGRTAEYLQRILPLEKKLPTWAAIYAESLPRTTIAMLRLDDFHRRHSPLGNRLASLLRWQVAVTLECQYAIEYAKFDLQQTGLSIDELEQLEAGNLALNDQLKRCMRYADKLTRAGFTITDEETSELLEELGEQDMVGVVQTVAFANFQYRLMIAVDAKLTEDEPAESFAPYAIVGEVKLPSRKTIDDLYLEEPGQEYHAPDSFTEASTELFVPSLKQQQQRSARITVPDAARVSRLDEEDQQSANRITWSRVAYGYQPEMTRLWFQCLRAYQQEAKPDSFFLNSVFWVVTRSNECFY